MLNLFIGSIGACSLASHIALEEAGADYKVTRLDFSKNEQKSAAYLKINPKARVPALVTDQGIITENPAILMFIAQTHPAAKLAPLDNPFALAQIQSFNSYLCATVHPNHAHKMRGYRWSDDAAVIDAMKIKVPQNMTECFALIESDYFKKPQSGPWVMGKDYSIADPYFYTLLTWLEGDGVDPGKFPTLIDYRNRMEQRPAVQKVRASYG
jgi:glutathione S-transferase